MIVFIKEIQEDSFETIEWYCDTERANPVLKAAIERALADKNGQAGIFFEAGGQSTSGLTFKENKHGAKATLPCLVDASIELYYDCIPYPNTDEDAYYDWEESIQNGIT